MESYWTISKGIAVRMGWSCRECKQPIYKGEKMICRDGRKIRLFYHPNCFTGGSDPRTQPGSSYNSGKFPKITSTAPKVKGYGKWSTTYGYQPSYY